ncbi:hypothetical protein IGI04_026803 [Brassica rapa subsp. trilocularis]|uniref:Uncharacterized protein n=1 Tax=Brassica rapa subsp. trilocularis TaxID=1813537 RepID=A0ABQ7KXK3_BRACM|nr:hypothetical protein IGI04_026803 [Brassica rapa subsp. trilocularis]
MCGKTNSKTSTNRRRCVNSRSCGDACRNWLIRSRVLWIVSGEVKCMESSEEDFDDSDEWSF